MKKTDIVIEPRIAFGFPRPRFQCDLSVKTKRMCTQSRTLPTGTATDPVASTPSDMVGGGGGGGKVNLISLC